MNDQTRAFKPSPTRLRHAPPAARDARARRRRAIAVASCAALLQAGSLQTAQARKPRAPKAASTPSTAQILAPSAATVPDALPPDKLIYRCGNSYSTQSCADAKPLDVADARSDAQRRQANELTARDKRLATWLEAQRHEREAGASAASGNGRAARASKDCGDKPKDLCRLDGPVVHPSRTVAILTPPVTATGKSK